MNSRVTTFVAGLIILALGLAGLFYPGRLMGLVGFAPVSTSEAANAHLEIRALFGGLFTVMGIFIVMAARDPGANKSQILFVGLMWLGAGAARLFGISIEGNPGLFGWLAVVIDLALGGVLVAAALLADEGAAFTSTPLASPPTTPQV